jgi:Restriction Enzyme Adenine Methylase Associated
MRETPQLVCQHLENISREALAKYQEIVRQYVRRRQGVYALYRRGKLYYVGLASDLRWRLNAHLKDRHGEQWDRFSVYLTIGDKHLRELESLLLRVVRPRPKGNKQKGKFADSENLLPQFKRAVRSLQQFELDDMIGRESGRTRKRVRRAPVQGGTTLASYINGPMELRAKLKGKTLRARVRRDGSIRFRGKVHRSPSAAGQAACQRSCNGWWFWKFERAPGDWVRLRELKR